MYLTLLRYIKAKMISHKSEIKLCLMFKRYTKQKQIKTEMRINAMLDGETKKKEIAGKVAYEQAIVK